MADVTLRGRVGVVTGAGQGLGRAIALELASAGARVVVADLNAGGASSVASEVRKQKGEAVSVEVDVTDENSVANLKDRAMGEFGRVDILVNNAGVYPHSLLVDMREEEWDRVLDTNVGGHFLCSRAFVPGMKAQQSGRIICTASAIAYKGARGFGHYAASKAGVLGFVRALARELAPYGITVNSISPGTADTSMPRLHRSDEELRQRAERNPLGRIACPEDIAKAVAFLVSDAAAYITGQSVLLTGGDLMV